MHRHRLTRNSRTPALFVAAALLLAACGTDNGDEVAAPEIEPDESPAQPDDEFGSVDLDRDFAGALERRRAREGEPESEPEPEPEPAAPQTVTVSMGDSFFSPEVIEIAAGDTIAWEHDGDINHTVTARDGSFDSGSMSSGDSFTHTVEGPGTIEYHCIFHTQMTGSVVAQ